jgi:hypothetical protein
MCYIYRRCHLASWYGLCGPMPHIRRVGICTSFCTHKNGFFFAPRRGKKRRWEISPLRRRLRSRLLGGFSVTVHGEPIEGHWRLRKAKTLVKILALAPAHRLHRGAISEMLWPDAEVETAANNLYQVVHPIRRIPDRHCIRRSWARPCAHRLQLRHDSGCVPCDVL